ncbi:MAG: ATP-binding protein [Rubrivivax sp.]|nr:ATP-binding protein [Rubrivivax sp.]
MLNHPTLEKLHRLRLSGMAHALSTQMQTPDIGTLSFEERLGLLLDEESTHRDNKRLTTRLRTAALRQSACLEDVDYRHARGLDKSMMAKLASGAWLREHLNCLITGPAGVGKSYLACALAHQACRDGASVRYLRLPRLLNELGLAKGDGRYRKLLAQLARTDLIVLDDFGLATFSDEQRRDLLEILEDRYERRSTIITSQFPVEHWHQLINDPTLADAILDRLVHNAYRLVLKGASMRKQRSRLTNTEADTK